MNILIIGGAGYIGSVVVERLLKDNNCVIIYDNFSTSIKASKNNINAKFIYGDMLDTDFLINVILENKIDLIIALAAKTIVCESVDSPIEYFDNNINGMISIIKAMVKTKVNKLIFSSSAAVYGQGSNKPILEDDIKLPINPYVQSKLVCEWLIEDAKKAFGINYIIFRFFNVAGASNSLKNGNRTKTPTSLIAGINKAIIEKKSPIIFGNDYKTRDGTCIRDYVHVQDLALAFELAISYLKKNKSNIFNLGSNVGSSVLEVMNQAKKTLNVDFNIVYNSRRNGDPDILVTNNSKALKELKWLPTKSLSEMIESDYNFRIKNVSK